MPWNPHTFAASGSMADAAEPQTLRGLRDRPLLQVRFAGAFRRSEFVALDAEHITQRDEGLAILKREGYPFNVNDAKHLSPFLTRHLPRFGTFPVRCETEPLPDSRRLDP